MPEIAIGLPTMSGSSGFHIIGHGIIRNNTVPTFARITGFAVNVAEPVPVVPFEESTHTLANQVFTLTGDSVYNKPRYKGSLVNFYGMTVTETKLIRDWTGFEQIQYNYTNPNSWEERGYVTGQVTLKNTTPLVRLLRLYHRDTGRLIDSTWSTVSGTYRFSASISLTDPYYVVCLNDGETDYNTIVHDWVVPDQL